MDPYWSQEYFVPAAGSGSVRREWGQSSADSPAESAV